MARKLKSDKVLFTTTILLVGLSIVMVYSASAPVALDRYGKASMFLIKQGLWAVLGLAMLSIGLLSGGYGEEELSRAGAYRVYHDPAELLSLIYQLGLRAS